MKKMKFYFYCICLLLVINIAKSKVEFIDEDDENIDDEILKDKTSKCKAYLTNYGFLVESKKCEKYCCGGCFDRYCCSNKQEAITNQKDCLNNYDPSSPSLVPIKKRSCDSYYDQNGDLVSILNCEGDKFCCGTCFNRTCDDKEYKWLDQSICPNQLIKPSTATTKISTTSKITISSTRQKKSTKRKPHERHLNRIVSLSVAGIVLVAVILFGVVIFKKFFAKNRIIEKNIESGEVKTSESDKPPPYPGY